MQVLSDPHRSENYFHVLSHQSDFWQGCFSFEYILDELFPSKNSHRNSIPCFGRPSQELGGTGYSHIPTYKQERTDYFNLLGKEGTEMLHVIHVCMCISSGNSH